MISHEKIHYINKKLMLKFKKKNIFATQFHPEKSDFDGLDRLKSLLNYKQ